MNEISNRIIELRTALNLSQEAFGEKISLVRSGISNIEKGIRNVSDRTVKLICQEYNVNEEWLRIGKGEMFKQAGGLEEQIAFMMDDLDDLDKKIISSYISLPKEHRKIIKEFIKKMATE